MLIEKYIRRRKKPITPLFFTPATEWQLNPTYMTLFNSQLPCGFLHFAINDSPLNSFLDHDHLKSFFFFDDSVKKRYQFSSWQKYCSELHRRVGRTEECPQAKKGEISVKQVNRSRIAKVLQHHLSEWNIDKEATSFDRFDQSVVIMYQVENIYVKIHPY